MARLYKTASAAPIDYMYRINTPLMEKVIGANDQYITQNLQQAQQLEDAAANFNYLQADDARAKAITEGYSKQIDSITDAIRNDPANWRKQLDPIRGVSRDLQQNYKVGEISKIASNYSQYKTVADAIDKQVEEYNKTGKGISSDRAMAYKQYFLNNFKGTNYNPATGSYSSMNAFTPMGNIDIRKALSEEMDKIKSDSSKYKKSETTGDEWYFNDQTKSWEGVTPQKILSIAYDRLMNPQLQDYMRQDSMVGLMNKVFDANGQMIAPFNYKGVPISPEEQKTLDNYKSLIAKEKNADRRAQMQGILKNKEDEMKARTALNWNDQESSLAPILRGIVNQYSYSKTDEENTLRNNAKGAAYFNQGQANLRQGRALDQARDLAEMREKGINDRFDKNLEWQKWKYNNPQDKKGTKKAGTDKDKPTESIVSQYANNPFESWMTNSKDDGSEVKVLSNNGLASDIDKFKKDIDEANKSIASIDKAMQDLKGNRSIKDMSAAETRKYNELFLQKETAQKALPKLQSDLDARRKWYQGSVDAALNNAPQSKKAGDADLTPEEIRIYKEGEAGQKRNNDLAQSYLNRAMDLRTNYPKIEPTDTPAQAQAKVEQLKKNRKEADRLDNLARELGYGRGADNLISVDTRKTKAYQAIKAKVDQRRENFLAQMRYTPYSTDAVKLGNQDSDYVSSLLMSNMNGLKLFDANGEKTDGVTLEGNGKANVNPLNWHSPKYDNYFLSTEALRPDAANGQYRNLQQYMIDHNVKMHVNQVGNTTSIGSGNALAEVTFEDPNGEIDGRTYYMEMTPELQKKVAGRLSMSNDAGIKAIANSMSDEEANSLRKQLITPTMTKTAGKSNVNDPVTFTIFLGNGNSKIPFQVTKFVNNDGSTNLTVTGTGANGEQIPLGRNNRKLMPPSGMEGLFHGEEELVQYLLDKKRNK